MARALKDIIIVGGSHAGMFAAIAMQNAGFDVRVFERAPEMLRGYGAGIRVQPRMVEILRDEGRIDLTAFSTRTNYDRHLAPRALASGNKVIFERPEEGQFASWGSMYRALISNFGADRYHCNEACVGTDEHDGRVEVRFASGRVETADLVIFADGIASTGRRRLNPKATMNYCGYVAWRGLVPETELSAATREALDDSRVFVVAGLSHLIVYAVPGEGDSAEDGARRINAIWYRNVPEGPVLDELMTDREGIHRPTSLRVGTVQQRQIDAFRRDVAAQLPPALIEVFEKSEPFVTPIYEVEPTRMVYGRRVLVGDASAGTRPHVSASTAKATRAAFGLAAALKDAQTAAEVTGRLAEWEREHLAIAWEFTERGRMIGRRIHEEGTYVPGTPEYNPITMPAKGGR